jgi:hypothetical protein
MQGLSVTPEQGIVIPVLLLKPASAQGRVPVVAIVSQGGKPRILAHRRAEIDSLLAAGVAVCLPDVRGTGETASDSRRGPMSADISLAATELMLGNHLLGARLKDLRTVLAYLESRPDIDRERMGVWGDSDVPVNPKRFLLDEAPGWQLSPQVQYQGEPMGGLLALFTGLYDGHVRAVAVRGGLSGYLSILEDPFVYLPSDVIVPDSAGAGDLDDVAAVIEPRSVLLHSLIDGRNRPVGGPPVKPVAEWMVAQLRR